MLGSDRISFFTKPSGGTSVSIFLRLKLVPLIAVLFSSLPICRNAMAQAASTLAPRLTVPIDDSQRSTLPNSRPSRSLIATDIGAVEPSMPIHSMVLDFSLTPSQKLDLDALVARQQDVESSLYHQWLSPERYGARFGMNDEDLETIELWLQRQGFSIDRVTRAKNHIVFSGTAAQVEQAFGAPIHRFQSADGSNHYAPAQELTLPTALQSVVSAIRGLSNYLPHPKYLKPVTTHSRHTPRFTDVNNTVGVPYGVTPGDIATIYDVNAAYQAGYTGAGQAIAVVGQSYAYPSDILRFQTLTGLSAANLPVFVLVPGTGSPQIFEGDEAESDLDLEYSSTIGKGAQVYFVYTGSYQQGAFYALEYAVDERIASIISTSYGACEVTQAIGANSAATEIADQDAILEQAVAQGQTILAAAGDDGSVDCVAETGEPLATLQSASVDYPASSPYVTAMGGTEFPENTYTTNASTYWTANTANSAPIVNSARSYIPEQVWNDDSPEFGTSAGGGGVSGYEAAPLWQAPGTLIGGVGIPTEPTINIGTARKPNNVEPRLVPDISLYASPNDPGFIFCSSDPSIWAAGQTGSCANGFYDDSGIYLTFAGGTSFDGPIFAGMLSILNQALNSTGQGNINPALYNIASSSISTYNSVFHDIVTGSNACYDFYETQPGYPAPPAPMPNLCGVGPAVGEYAATVGYDMASGLGSIDFYNLLNSWPRPSSASLLATTTKLNPATSNPSVNALDSVTILVGSSGTAPTGTVSVSVDGAVVNASLNLSGGVATYAFASALAGAHVVTSTYSGDATHAASSGTMVLNVGTTTPGFTLSATPVGVTQGATGISTVTVTPAGGYTGTVLLTLTAPATLSDACATFTSPQINGTAPVAVTFTIYTDSNNCPTGAVTLARHAQRGDIGTKPFNSRSVRRDSKNAASLALSLGGLLLLSGLRRRSRLPRSVIAAGCLIILSMGAIGITGCTPSPGAEASASGSLQSAAYESAPGSYALTVSGVDSGDPGLTASTTIALTVQ